MEDIEEQLAAFPIRLNIPVQWGEMDAAQHVSNVVYLEWFEAARVKYVTTLGYDVIIDESNMGQPGFILAWQDCKYIFPVTYPDTVTIGIKTVEMGPDRFRMLCKMFSLQHQRIVAIAHGTMVTYDYYNRKKANIPPDLRESISSLESINFE